jgi:hypothetical protein
LWENSLTHITDMMFLFFDFARGGVNETGL